MIDVIALARATAALLAFLAVSGCKPPLDPLRTQADAMEADRRLIGQIQGTGDTSPLLGQAVAIEGMVLRSLAGDADDLTRDVGMTLGTGNGGLPVGWFVQDEGDGNAATSDAVFVQDDAYNTSIGMPAETTFTLRLGTQVRTGDRIRVRGTVTEVPQALAAEQRRSSGRRVSRGDRAGTVTAIVASNIRLLSPREHAALVLAPPLPRARLHEEAVEGMRIEPARLLRRH